MDGVVKVQFRRTKGTWSNPTYRMRMRSVTHPSYLTYLLCLIVQSAYYAFEHLAANQARGHVE